MKSNSKKFIGGKIWEDGTFGLSIMREEPIDLSLFNPDREQQAENARWLHQLTIEHGADVVQEYLSGVLAGEVTPGSELGLSTVLNSHTEDTRARRGLKGITSYGKNLVRNGCLRLDREASGNLAFLTLTLPNISASEAVKLGQSWHQVLRTFNQWLSRALNRGGVSGELVGVTEIQTKRFKETGVCALHYHCCFQARASRYEEWILRPQSIREAWRRTVLKYLDGSPEDYDWRSCENIQRVRRSVGSYLGKYLSKGLNDISDDNSDISSDISSMYPSAWYSITNTLRIRVLGNRVHLSQGKAESLFGLCNQEDYDSWFIWVKPIILWAEDGFTVVGWCGKLWPEAKDLLLSGGFA